MSHKRSHLLWMLLIFTVFSNSPLLHGAVTNASLKMECKLTATHDYFSDQMWDVKVKFLNEYNFVFETELDFSKTNYEVIGSTTYALLNQQQKKAKISVFNRGFLGIGQWPNEKLTEIFDEKMKTQLFAIRHGQDAQYRVSHIGFTGIDQLNLEEWQAIYTFSTGWDNPPLNRLELNREREELLPNFVSFYRAEYNQYFNQGILMLVFPKNFQFFERVTLWLSGCSGTLKKGEETIIPINASYLQIPSSFFY